MKKHIALFLMILCGLLAARVSDVQAGLFAVTTSSDGTITARGDQLFPLLREAILAEGRFSTLAKRGTYEISLNYAGVRNALVFSLSRVVVSNSVHFVLTSPSGYSVTNSSRNALADKVQRDVRDHSPAAVWQENPGRSIIAVTDGNPGSTTAILAEQAFEEFAFEPGGQPSPSEFGNDEQSAIRVSPDFGTIHAGPYRGTSFTLPLRYRRNLSERVRLSLNVPLNYTEIENAEVFRGGLIAGFPVRLLSLDTNQVWSWQVSPSVGLLAGASSDLADGALVGQLAFSSALAREFGFCKLTLGNQFSAYETTSFSGYDSDLSQQILKNGLKIGVPIKGRWGIEAWGIHSHFLQSAVLPNFFTVGGAVTYRYQFPGKPGQPPRQGILALGVYSHLGDDYAAPHARFGTEWKF